MVQLAEFAVAVIVISISGVMSPGPLFAANISYGLREGTKAGLKMAYGHTVVELPLVILLGIGALSLEVLPQFRETIALLGAISLFAFAGIQIRSVLKKPTRVFEGKHGPFLAGIMLSALNPFFLVWWFTIGFKLISDALVIASFAGIGIMFVFHIWMDYAWLCTVSFLSSKGKKILSNKNYTMFMIGISGVLIYFGIAFAKEALS
ncbi:MAG TPA: LysE family transporter [Nitrosopumilaceae archaeon]|nr:LysE family transporter [Nitrosopumilaceae archaeon]